MARLTAKYRPYPAYRPSDVGWLGNIPAHWEVKRLKYLATVNDEALPETTDPEMEITYVDIGNVDSIRGITASENLVFENAPSRARRVVRQGDVIISTVRTYLKAVARIEPTDVNLIVSTGFAVVRPRHLDDAFVAYALSSPYFVERVVAHSTGVGYPAINASELACLNIAFPPFPEQRAIADFLDRETARIDAMVSREERLIELLQEKRAALITRTVTHGLDLSVQLKDSGVEWLGEIPAHWDVKRLKYVAHFINGAAFNPAEWGTEGTPIIRIQNLNGGEDFNYTARKLPTKYVSQEGDLLFGWSGNRGTSFGPFLWWRKGEYYLNQHIFRVLPLNVTKDWFYWALKAVTFHVEKQAHGIIGMVHITRDELGVVYIPIVPNVSEQRAIASFLGQETVKLDGLIAKVREAMDRLKELRTALISAAVTGRIDVREEAG